MPPRVQLQPGAQGLAVLRTFGEFSEEAEFDGTEQGLRTLEANGQLRDRIRGKFEGH